MSNTEKEMVDAAKSEEKIRVYTELGLSQNPAISAKDSNYLAINLYFENLLKQKHINAQIKRIKDSKDKTTANDDPHFSQFLYEAANNPDIGTEATNKLIAHEIRNANHDLLANVVAALIFEPSQNKKKLEDWGKLVNDTAGLTSQGNQLWGEGTGKWRETLVFKRTETQLNDVSNALQFPNALLTWGVKTSADRLRLLKLLKESYASDYKSFILLDNVLNTHIKKSRALEELMANQTIVEATKQLSQKTSNIIYIINTYQK